uniref:Protein FAR1-RELATED SEQUENCE n=2 Tax=Kalanchoe fedtschenkoi TaxID=63787 RepID=A0A7N0TUD7_KALFE
MESSEATGNVTSEPHRELEFESHEDAYSYYKEYAKLVGFGTAKLSSRRSRASKEFIDAKFSCIRYGNKQQSDDAINPRPSPKIGCKASMHVKRRQTGKWYIYNFVKDHNHELLPEQAHFFRSHRNVDSIKNDLRIRKRKILAAGSKQFSAYQNVDFLEGYIRNQHDKGQILSLESGDSQMLLEFCMYMQDKNPKFFYAMDFNEEHRLRNVFWVSSKGVDDYNYFSDVVSVDTTYVTAKYKIPLVIIMGVNNHIQPTLLGCGLIADETLYTFVWLLQTWLISMGGRAPRVILTDQNSALKQAVAAVLPESRHCFALWNVLEKIPSKLEYVIRWQDNFVIKFDKCIYKSLTEEQFESRWSKLLDRFTLREDEWVQSLYEDRRQWVPTFMRDISFAGLSAPSRAESLNTWFDNYIDAYSSLREFIERYKLIVEDMHEEEAKANFDGWHETPDLKTPSPFEKQTLLVYTHEIFKKFQIEVLGAAACHLKKENDYGTIATYSVKDFADNQVFMVTWDQTKLDIGCSCRSFEYKGYVCRHAIVVLQMSGVFSIPFKYILQRWTNVAVSRHAMSDRLDEVQAKIRRFNDLCRRAIILGEEGSLSEQSYNVALIAIEDALKQFKNTSSLDCDSRPHSALRQAFSGNEEVNDGSVAAAVHEVPGTSLTSSSKSQKRSDAGNKKFESYESMMGKVQPVQGLVNAGSQVGYAFMDNAHATSLIPNAPLVAQHNMAPVRLQSLPAHIQNTMPAQYHSSIPPYVEDKHIQDKSPPAHLVHML